MQVSYKCDYALKALLCLCMKNDKGLMSTLELSSRLDIPKKFLEQVLLDLKRGGFAESKRGKDGGYFLARPACEISLGQVLRFIDGPLDPIACLDDNYKGCADMPNCVFRPVFKKTAEAINSVVDAIDFHTLVNNVEQQKGFLDYTI